MLRQNRLSDGTESIQRNNVAREWVSDPGSILQLPSRHGVEDLAKNDIASQVILADDRA